MKEKKKTKWNLKILATYLSVLVDIAAAFDVIKSVLNYYGVEEKAAAAINAMVFIIAFVLLIWLFIDKKLRKAGTHNIPCTLSAYRTFKIDNKSRKILRNIHCEMYHEIVKVKNIISNERKDRIKKENKNHLEYKDFNKDVTALLDKFHSILNNVFKLDLSIIVYLSTEENSNKILKRWIFIQNEEEKDLGEQRDKERNYIFYNSNDKELNGYAISAENHFKQNDNGDYWANSIFDYLMTSNNSHFMSNDLRVDKKEGSFFTTNGKRLRFSAL